MRKEEFIKEYIEVILNGYDLENYDLLKKCINLNLNKGLTFSNYTNYKKIKKINELSQEDFLNISSLICAMINLKNNLSSIEEETYKLIKEKCKTIYPNFSVLIKESTTKLYGAMFYSN